VAVSSVVEALEYLKTMPGRIGLDIGGSLAKMAFMQDAPQACDLADRFGVTGRRHPELSFEVVAEGRPHEVHFISGSTAQLERALMQHKHQTDGGTPRRVVASGGGAHRFAHSMREVLNVEMLPLQEMESLVRGLSFLHDHGPQGEVFLMDPCREEVPADWPAPLLPCLLVNIGSGVSVLRVDKAPRGPPPGDSFVRLGGTACGGATFLGLARLMTSAKTFEEALQLAQSGDNMQVNKLVGDIYGTEGCAHLGLPANLTAAYFGKLMSMDDKARGAIGEADIAAGLLQMVVQESVVLARAFSQLVSVQIGHAPPIFFIGGFLAHNAAARQIITNSFKLMNCGPAYFLRHADFLGAMGSLMECIKNRKSWADSRR